MGVSVTGRKTVVIVFMSDSASNTCCLIQEMRQISAFLSEINWQKKLCQTKSNKEKAYRISE